MAAVNDNALSKFVGLLYVAPQASPGSLVRIASVRGLIANFDNTANQVDIKADDTGTVFKGFLPEGSIEGSFLENVERDTIAMLLGGTPADIAASIVNNHVQTVASGAWAYNVFIPFEFQNGNGTAPNVDSVVGSVDGALVSETDYFIGKNDLGVWGIFIKNSVTVTTLVQSIAIQFDYTPNAAENITLPITFQESPRLYVKIVATDNGKDRTIILDDATFEGKYGLEFLDVVEAGDIKGTEFSFKASKGSNFIIQNEIL
jgi:hypothetical protein